MLLLRLIEWCLGILLLIGVILEVAVPIFRGTSTFPALRGWLLSGHQNSSHDVIRAREELDTARNYHEAAELRHQRDDVEIDTARLNGTGPTEKEYLRQCKK